MTASLFYLKVWLLEDPGQLGCAVVFHLQVADVTQDLCHQLHIVVLHCFQLYFLHLLMSLYRGNEAGVKQVS